MGFLGNLISSVVKVVATPVAVAVDLGKVAVGIEADTTKNLLNSAMDDLSEAGNDIFE